MVIRGDSGSGAVRRIPCGVGCVRAPQFGLGCGLRRFSPNAPVSQKKKDAPGSARVVVCTRAGLVCSGTGTTRPGIVTTSVRVVALVVVQALAVQAEWWEPAAAYAGEERLRVEGGGHGTVMQSARTCKYARH